MKRQRGRDLNEVLEIRKARRRIRLRAVLLGAALLGAVVWFIATNKQRALVRDIVEERVVILPLDNRTGDPELDAVSVIAADWTNRLMTLFRSSVDVVPTTTTLAYYRSANLVVHELQERAELLAFGVSARRVAWGTFYQIGDSIRFDVQISDIVNEGRPERVVQAITPKANLMDGVDRVAETVARNLLDVYTLRRVGQLKPAPLPAYASYTGGLDAFARRMYGDAATHFEAAAQNDTSYRFRLWLADALLRDRQFARADSVLDTIKRRRVPLGDLRRAYYVYNRLHGDWETTYRDFIADEIGADDLTAFDYAMAALALNRPREARRILEAQHPSRGALRTRPDYYLHLAAAYHLFGDHARERRVARRALFAHPTSVEAKLAQCRAAAGRADEEDAQIAVDRLAAVGAEPESTVTTVEALRDCAAELHVHGLPDLAQRAQALANAWSRRRPPSPPVQRDPVYERGYVAFDSARAAAERGDAATALEQLWFALDHGLPAYEPGRMMLHAEPAFRRLRNTRGFIQMTRPQG